MASPTYTITSRKVGNQTILIAGLASAAAAIFANLVARAILFSSLDLPADFPPLSAASISLFTALGISLGVLIFALLNSRTRTPRRLYAIFAVVALIVSLIPNFALIANPAAAPVSGGTAMSFGVLIVFHIVAALTHLSIFLPVVQN